MIAVPDSSKASNRYRGHCPTNWEMRKPSEGPEKAQYDAWSPILQCRKSFVVGIGGCEWKRDGALGMNAAFGRIGQYILFATSTRSSAIKLILLFDRTRARAQFR